MRTLNVILTRAKCCRFDRFPLVRFGGRLLRGGVGGGEWGGLLGVTSPCPHTSSSVGPSLSAQPVLLARADSRIHPHTLLTASSLNNFL